MMRPEEPPSRHVLPLLPPRPLALPDTSPVPPALGVPLPPLDESCWQFLFQNETDDE